MAGPLVFFLFFSATGIAVTVEYPFEQPGSQHDQNKRKNEKNQPGFHNKDSVLKNDYTVHHEEQTEQ